MNIVSDLFAVVGAVITGFTGALADGLSAVAEMFYDPTPTTGGFTFLGTLLLISVGAGIVIWLINLVRSLVGKKIG